MHDKISLFPIKHRRLFLFVILSIGSGCIPKSAKSRVKLIGGSEDASSFPPGVGLKMVGAGNLPLGVCTGTIVRSDLVLTAAHCFDEFKATGAVVFDQSDGPLTKRNLRSQSFVMFPGYSYQAGAAGFLAGFTKDVAFAIFPKDTFESGMIATLGTSPAKGDHINFIGYGQTGYQDAKSNADLKRFSGSNVIGDIDQSYASGILVFSAVVGDTTTGLGSGDSGGPAYNDNNQLVGILDGNAISLPTNAAQSSASLTEGNSKISSQTPLVSFIVNINDAGIAAFIGEVMADSEPSAASAQDVTPSKITQPGSSTDADHAAPQLK